MKITSSISFWVSRLDIERSAVLLDSGNVEETCPAAVALNRKTQGQWSVSAGQVRDLKTGAELEVTAEFSEYLSAHDSGNVLRSKYFTLHTVKTLLNEGGPSYD